MKSAGRCRFAAIADVTVGADEIQAFALGPITEVKRAFGMA